MKSFRDPVHNIIKFDRIKDEMILDLINANEMQRLRHIKQLGFGCYTYPGAEHSRFAHSLGVTHLIKRIINRLSNLRSNEEKKLVQDITDNYLLLLSTALLHDIGHGPFSHAIEEVIGIKHERWSMQIINNPETKVNKVLENHSRGFSQKVSDVIARIYPVEAVVKLLSSQLDADRFDYLLRDSLMTGVGYGRFDLEWMLNTITIGLINETVEVGLDYDKGLSIAEDFVMARYYMYKHVYHHKTTRGIEILAKKLFFHVKKLSNENRIACPIQLKSFFNEKETLEEKINNYLSHYLELTDNFVWYWFREWSKCDDIYLKDLCDRILKRRLLKSIDISDLNPNDWLGIIEILKYNNNFKKDFYNNYIEIDTPSESPYNDPYIFKKTKMSDKRPSDNVLTADAKDNLEQEEATEYIFLIDKDKRCYDLARESVIINAIREKKYGHHRLYYPTELRDMVQRVFEERGLKFV